MEESLRVLTRESIAGYCRVIDEFAAFKVEILSTHKAAVSHSDPHPPQSKTPAAPAPVRAPSGAADTAAADAAAGGPPLQQDPFFVVDLKIVNGMVNYSTPPEEFAQVPICLYCKTESRV